MKRKIKLQKRKQESNQHAHDQSLMGRFGSKPLLAFQKGGSQTQITFHVKRSKPFRMKIQKNNHQLLNNNIKQQLIISNLKAFSVDNTRSALIIFILRYPHFLKCTQRRQNTASNPHRILSL